MTERDYCEAMNEALSGCKPVTISLDAVTLWCVVSAIQLASRHPRVGGNSGMQKAIVFAKDLERVLGEQSLRAADLAALGWDTRHDIAGNPRQ